MDLLQLVCIHLIIIKCMVVYILEILEADLLLEPD